MTWNAAIMCVRTNVNSSGTIVMSVNGRRLAHRTCHHTHADKYTYTDTRHAETQIHTRKRSQAGCMTIGLLSIPLQWKSENVGYYTTENICRYSFHMCTCTLEENMCWILITHQHNRKIDTHTPRSVVILAPYILASRLHVQHGH